MLVPRHFTGTCSDGSALDPFFLTWHSLASYKSGKTVLIIYPTRLWSLLIKDSHDQDQLQNDFMALHTLPNLDQTLP